MKNSILTVLIAVQLLFTTFIKADNLKTTPAKVTAATVFLRGAQLTCSADFTASPGNCRHLQKVIL